MGSSWGLIRWDEREFTNLAYDAAGNLTQDFSSVPTHTYQWDAEGRLSSIDNGSTTTFIYNALGQVARRTSGSPYIDYAWDAAGHQLGTYNGGTGAWWEQLFWVGGRELGYNFPGTYFIHRNALGSNSMITNYSGGVYSDALFYPWGQIWQTGDTGMSYYAGFMGYEGDLGIYTPIFRSYFPRLYRWPSPDPLTGNPANPQSLNRYAYVLNNPTNLIDPLGLIVCQKERCPDPAPEPPGALPPPGACNEVDVNGLFVGDTCHPNHTEDLQQLREDLRQRRLDRDPGSTPPANNAAQKKRDQFEQCAQRAQQALDVQLSAARLEQLIGGVALLGTVATVGLVAEALEGVEAIEPAVRAAAGGTPFLFLFVRGTSDVVRANRDFDLAIAACQAEAGFPVVP